jgi:hypothetical protein
MYFEINFYGAIKYGRPIYGGKVARLIVLQIRNQRASFHSNFSAPAGRGRQRGANLGESLNAAFIIPCIYVWAHILAVSKGPYAEV